MNNNHHPTTRSSGTASNDLMKKTPSPRRQTTRSTSNINKDNLSSTNIQVIKPVAVRPPSSDSSQTSYNLRSRTKLKTSNTNHTTEVIPSFTEKLSLETPQQKPVPPLTRAAAASAGVKIDSFICDDSIKTSNINNKILINSQQSTRPSTTRKRKASEDDHRPYLDLLKMKQVIYFDLLPFFFSRLVNMNEPGCVFFSYMHSSSVHLSIITHIYIVFFPYEKKRERMLTGRF
jgi:hypothetical protein